MLQEKSKQSHVLAGEADHWAGEEDVLAGGTRQEGCVLIFYIFHLSGVGMEEKTGFCWWWKGESKQGERRCFVVEAE